MAIRIATRFRGRGRGLLLPFFFALLALSPSVQADPSCPAGKVHRWTVTGVGSGYVNPTPCSLGQTFSSESAFIGACKAAHGTSSGGSTHWSGVRDNTYNGTASSSYINMWRHNSSHNNAGSRVEGLVTAQHTCVTDTTTCSVPAGSRLSALMYFSTAGNGSCVSNCSVVMQKEMEVDGLGAIYNAYSTGNSCTTGTSIPDVDPDGCVGTTGQCVNNDIEGPSDGVDAGGEPSGATWEALTEEGCVTTESGAAFCIVSAPTGARPNNGTVGVPATPNYTTNYYGDRASPGNTSSTVNYYSSTTVNNSTNYGNGGDPAQPGNCGAPGQPACTTKGACGGPGQPACKTKIDEGGTPSGSNYAGPEFDQDEAREAIEAVAESNPAAGHAPSWIPDLSGTACQSLVFNLPKGFVLTIPGADGCSFLATIMGIVSFFLGLFTAWTCWQRIMETI